MQSAGAEVERQVMELMSGCFSKEELKIEVSSRLVEDLNADSMSVVEIVMMLNETFDVDLPPETVGAWRTVADICRSVNACR